MNLKNLLLCFAVFILITAQTKSQNTNPVVSNVTFNQSGTTVTVNYDIYDLEQDHVTITMKVSSNNGVTWDFSYFPAYGDIGMNVAVTATPSQKEITWEYSGASMSTFQVMIIANDETADGSSCGNEYFEGGPNSDAGGAYYNTIQIGTQCWFKENLNVGSMIPGSSTPDPGFGIQKYCYDDQPSNCENYGGLYPWSQAMMYTTNENAQGICPAGWHIPSEYDLMILGITVNNNMNSLKAIGQGGGDGAGTNTSGFSGLLVGNHQYNVGFENFYVHSIIWGSTTLSSSNVSYLFLDKSSQNYFSGLTDKPYATSVRCMKDEFTCGISTVNYDGQIYHTVQIGTQCWLKENLNVGTTIAGNLNQTDNNTKEKYCYDNIESNCLEYGGLYQWDETMQYSTTEGVQGICPTGWHIPTTGDFNILTDFVGNDASELLMNGSNTTHFSALFTGSRYMLGSFADLGNVASFWNSTEHDATYANVTWLDAVTPYIYVGNNDKLFGLSVRCIKDDCATPEPPILIHPLDGEIDVIHFPTLNWNAGAYAQSYHLQVSTNNNFTPLIFEDQNIQSTSLVVSGLDFSTTYFWRVKAINGICQLQSDWSEVWSFTTISDACGGTTEVTHGNGPHNDGNPYHTVSIGTQCWLKENLNIGGMISGNENPTNDLNIQKYCYDNLESNCNTYGGLYQWNESMQYITTEGVQGICPSSWHIPTWVEFQTLSSFVGGSADALLMNGTNDYGFSALLAGSRSFDGNFIDEMLYGNYWSSTIQPQTPTYAYTMILNNQNNNVNLSGGYNYAWGLSVRCVKDDCPPLEPPQQTQPLNGELGVVITPTLSWNASTNAESYSVQVSTNDQFTNIVSEQNNITNTNIEVSGLTPATIYYWRVSAVNGNCISDWSDVWSFTTSTPCPGEPRVHHEGGPSSDDEGAYYNTVQIGSQCWLKENLNVGSMVDGVDDQIDNYPTNSIQKYCWIDNLNFDYCNKYGGLYQWAEAVKYSNGATNSSHPNPSFTDMYVQGICPDGWHIPSLSELNQLWAFVGDGKKLKAFGEGTGNGVGTNESGFSALMASWRNGHIDEVHNCLWCSDSYTSFWNTSYPEAEEIAYFNHLRAFDSEYGNGWSWKKTGFSIRCIKDETECIPPDIPSQLQPSDGEINVSTTLTLSWTPSAGTSNYHLQVATDNQFNAIYNEYNITSTSQEVTGLSNSTTYYWRVNAGNGTCTSDWTKKWSFTTISDACGGTTEVTYDDGPHNDGNPYHTVSIGTQCWLKENLNIGDMIQGNENQTDNSNIQKYCYDNNPSNCGSYGGLYQWNEAMQYVTAEGAQGICPTDWHIPTSAEFSTLATTVGNDGNKLKRNDQGSGNGQGTDDFGFSALLAGYRNHDGNFNYLTNYALFWSSSENGATFAHYMDLYNGDSSIFFYYSVKEDGYSVRCIKN